MYNIFLLRHGESVGVQQGILQGHLDLPLTARGKEQIQRLAEFWSARQQKFDLALVSPLVRAKETCAIVAGRLNIPQVDEEPDWIERDFGKGEGANISALLDWYKTHALPTPFAPSFETGETEWQVHLRAGRAIEKLLALPEGNYLVVSHGNVINAAMHMILGILPHGQTLAVEMSLGPGCFTQLRYDPSNGWWKLISFNVDVCQ